MITLALALSVSQLVDRWDDLNEECRGSYSETVIARTCPERDRIYDKIVARGWCHGEGAAYEYQVTWKPKCRHFQ